MKKPSMLRPSPALIVAFIALFVALSGTGYAVKLGSGSLKKNAVTSSKIKRNAVTASKIRKNAVTKSKIKKNNVTGDKILESSLGKVPDADKLDGLDSAAYEKSSKYVRVARFDLGNNESKEMAKAGPFTFSARCRINQDTNGAGPLDDLAEILIATSQDNSAFQATTSTPDLDVGTAEVDRVFSNALADTGTQLIDHEDDAFAIGADGTQVNAEVWTGVNLFAQPGRCQFGGILFVA